MKSSRVFPGALPLSNGGTLYYVQHETTWRFDERFCSHYNKVLLKMGWQLFLQIHCVRSLAPTAVVVSSHTDGLVFAFPLVSDAALFPSTEKSEVPRGTGTSAPRTPTSCSPEI